MFREVSFVQAANLRDQLSRASSRNERYGTGRRGVAQPNRTLPRIYAVGGRAQGICSLRGLRLFVMKYRVVISANRSHRGASRDCSKHLKKNAKEGVQSFGVGRRLLCEFSKTQAYSTAVKMARRLDDYHPNNRRLNRLLRMRCSSSMEAVKALTIVLAVATVLASSLA